MPHQPFGRRGAAAGSRRSLMPSSGSFAVPARRGRARRAATTTPAAITKWLDEQEREDERRAATREHDRPRRLRRHLEDLVEAAVDRTVVAGVSWPRVEHELAALEPAAVGVAVVARPSSGTALVTVGMTAKLYGGGGERRRPLERRRRANGSRPGRRAAERAHDQVRERAAASPAASTKRADRLEQVVRRPSRAPARVRVDAPRHPEQADDVHREERAGSCPTKMSQNVDLRRAARGTSGR